MAYHGSLGLCVVGCGTQNTNDANIEGRIAGVRPFSYLGRVKNRGVVTTLAGFILSPKGFGDFMSLAYQVL